jgi:hypothetical protein
MLIASVVEVARGSVLAASWLRNIGLDGHATGDDVSSDTTTGSILRGGRATESLCQLLYQGLGDVVDRNVNGVCNAEDDERPLTRVRQHSIGGVQFRVGSILNLTDAYTTFADDGPNENVRNEKTHWVRL